MFLILMLSFFKTNMCKGCVKETHSQDWKHSSRRIFKIPNCKHNIKDHFHIINVLRMSSAVLSQHRTTGAASLHEKMLDEPGEPMLGQKIWLRQNNHTVVKENIFLNKVETMLPKCCRRFLINCKRHNDFVFSSGLALILCLCSTEILQPCHQEKTWMIQDRHHVILHDRLTLIH